MTASPISRTVHDELVNDVRALKARLCLGLPVLGLAIAQLVATVAVRDDPAIALSSSVSAADYPRLTMITVASAFALVLVLALAALQLSRPARIVAVVLAALHGTTTIVLWGLLGTTDRGDVHAVAGYLALPTAATWALIGAVSAGRYAD